MSGISGLPLLLPISPLKRNLWIRIPGHQGFLNGMTSGFPLFFYKAFYKRMIGTTLMMDWSFLDIVVNI
jgi:hypothetical protein